MQVYGDNILNVDNISKLSTAEIFSRSDTSDEHFVSDSGIKIEGL